MYKVYISQHETCWPRPRLGGGMGSLGWLGDGSTLCSVSTEPPGKWTPFIDLELVSPPDDSTRAELEEDVWERNARCIGVGLRTRENHLECWWVDVFKRSHSSWFLTPLIKYLRCLPLRSDSCFTFGTLILSILSVGLRWQASMSLNTRDSVSHTHAHRSAPCFPGFSRTLLLSRSIIAQVFCRVLSWKKVGCG